MTDADRRLLEARARRLAQAAPSTRAAEGTQVLVITRGSARFGLPTADILEVLPEGHLTRVPEAPEAIVGVTSLRGTPLAVGDLALIFETGAGAPTGDGRLVVLGDERPRLALRADRADTLVQLAPSQLGPPPDALSPASRRLAAGLAPDATLLLDPRALLGDPRLGGA